ncbi:MAG: hypothetical protein ACJAYU_002508 [Bradymonadia bacterium]|jgi:hypothetical protein
MNAHDRLFASLAALLVVIGCSPVSDEARLTITGTVLNEDGSPAADQLVELYKADLPILDSEWFLAAVIQGSTTYRTIRTGSDGYFEFSLGGAEANTVGQGFAASFTVAAVRGEDRQLSVASQQFQFSNNDLREDVPDLQFWDGVNTAVDADSVDVRWIAPPVGAEVHVALPTGVWLEATEAGSLDLPLTLLPPGETSHEVLLFAVSGDLRYRTSVHTFEAINPLGQGIDYRDPDTNASALDCAGGNIFDLKDGVYADTQGQGSHLFADDTGGEHCVIINLQGNRAVDHVTIHGGNIIGLQDATVEVSVREGDGEWTVVDILDGRMTAFDSYYRDLPNIGMTADELKIEIVSQTDAHFLALGEVVIHVTE